MGALGFENAYAFAMKKDRAVELGISSIADLAKHSPDLTIAGDFDFFGLALRPLRRIWFIVGISFQFIPKLRHQPNEGSF